jgi:hypothetical protein
MEQIYQPDATGMQQSAVYPTGVTTVQQPIPGGAPTYTQPTPVEPIVEESTSFWGRVNYLEIGAGIILTTLFCYMVYYYRVKTNQYDTSVQEQNKKISSLQSDVNSLKNPQ